MEMKEIIKKVNHYAALAKKRELSPEEQKERAKYRELYLQQFRAQVRGHLDSVKIVDPQENNKIN